MSKDLADLHDKIKRIHNLLNGKDKTGNNLSFFSDCKHVRYFVVLYYAMKSPLSNMDAVKKSGQVYYNLYKLDKVAKRLSLDFDRTHTAKRIYEDAEERGELSRLKKDNKEYISLTDKGIETCENLLDEMLLFENKFSINPRLIRELENSFQKEVFDLVKRINNISRRIEV